MPPVYRNFEDHWKEWEDNFNFRLVGVAGALEITDPSLANKLGTIKVLMEESWNAGHVNGLRSRSLGHSGAPRR